MTDVGQVFNSLTFQGMASKSEAFFLCECGEFIQAKLNEVKRGKRKTCGGTAHKQVNNIKTKSSEYQLEHLAFLDLLKRYETARVPPKLLEGYWVEPKLHPAWNPRIVPNAFENFYADVGPKPIGTELILLRPCGDFTPDNVRWIHASDASSKAGTSSARVGRTKSKSRKRETGAIREATAEFKSELQRYRSSQAPQQDH